MHANQIAHDWISRFCVCLMQQRPGISTSYAVRKAVDAYPYFDDLPPDEAAKIVAPLVPHSRSIQQSRSQQLAIDWLDKFRRRVWGARSPSAHAGYRGGD